MKLFFKRGIYLIILAAIIGSAQGKTRRKLFKITYAKNEWLAEKAREILQQNYGIPKSFIHLKQKVHPCRSETSRDSLLHICATESGHEILRAKTRILKQSFEIFRPVKGQTQKGPHFVGPGAKR